MCHLMLVVHHLLSLLVPQDNIFPCTDNMYQFDPNLFHNPDQEFDVDVVEAKLFALMKSTHAVNGCKLV